MVQPSQMDQFKDYYVQMKEFCIPIGDEMKLLNHILKAIKVIFFFLNLIVLKIKLLCLKRQSICR